MTIADRIKMARESKGWTQQVLAEKMGLKDKTSVAKIEKSGDKVSLKNIQKCSIALDCSVKDLMGWEDVITGYDVYDDGVEVYEVSTVGTDFASAFGIKPPHNDPEFERLKDIYNKLEDKKALLDYAEYLAEKERR